MISTAEILRGRERSNNPDYSGDFNGENTQEGQNEHIQKKNGGKKEMNGAQMRESIELESGDSLSFQWVRADDCCSNVLKIVINPQKDDPDKVLVFTEHEMNKSHDIISKIRMIRDMETNK